MELPTSSSYLQLYTPEDRKSIAIEPMSCIANAFNNGEGLKILEVAEEFKWEVKIEVCVG
jgi:aldose 1-epimerase